MGDPEVNRKLPNIIFLVMDTAGAKHMSLYGYHRRTTPHLEKMAEECRVYTRCFAPGCWTVPSHASMFTGLYPSQHGACEGAFLLHDNLQHLVPAVKMAGYRTIGISSNGLVSPATGLCGEFDEFTDFGNDDLHLFMNMQGAGSVAGKEGNDLWTRLKGALTVREVVQIFLAYICETRNWSHTLQAGSKLVKKQLRRLGKPSPLTKSSRYTEKTVRLFREILERYSHAQDDQPFFLFMNVMEAHQAYRPPLSRRRFSRWWDKAWVDPQRFYRRGRSEQINRLLNKYRNLYDDEILFLDAILGQLWQILKDSPMFDNTVLIITADHGEHLGEKGHYTHILSLYNELLWVPLIIRFPGGLTEVGRDDRLVSLADLYPTILDLIDSPLPRPETCLSLMNAARRDMALAQLVYPEMYRVQLEGRQEVEAAAGAYFSPPLFAAITEGGLKIIEKKDGSLEVFNLLKDMDEEKDLAPDLSPEALEDFRGMLRVCKEETGFHLKRAEILQSFREAQAALS
jgi:arylsulfatase A-like enzyme